MMWGLVNMRIFVWCGRCWTEMNHYQSLVAILPTKSRRCITWNCSNGQGVLLHILVTPNQSPCSYVSSCVWVYFSSQKKSLYFVWCGFFLQSRIKRIGRVSCRTWSLLSCESAQSFCWYAVCVSVVNCELPNLIPTNKKKTQMIL